MHTIQQFCWWPDLRFSFEHIAKFALFGHCFTALSVNRVPENPWVGHHVPCEDSHYRGVFPTFVAPPGRRLLDAGPLGVTTKSDGNEHVLHADQEKYGYLGTWKCSWIFHNSDDCSIEIAFNSSIYVHDYLIKIHCLNHWIIDYTPVLPMNLSIQITFGSVWAPLKSICFDGVPMFDGMPAKNTCVSFLNPFRIIKFCLFLFYIP